ncbi:MAG: hypothetical protein HYR63_05365 [Proteobacteria bacterium]|nr:hypothetical protein [Pseudomonadota bacterium]MBI3495875.1 hypothetical protein [Pseudomonadota bacterium]
MARFFRFALLALLLLPLPRSALAIGSITMVGTVSNPASLTAASNATAVENLTNTGYDLDVGALASGQSWTNATLSLYLSHGQYVAVPSLSITDASGAAISATASGAIVTENGASTGVVNYQISSDLPANAILHFSGFRLFNLANQPSGTAIQIIAVANGSASSFRQYANWQTLATIGAGTATGITPQSGWWWSSAEPGRGYALEVENGHLMLAAYMYRVDGTSVWYIATGTLTGTEFSAPLYEYAGGGTLAGNPQPASQLGQVATVAISFASTTQATIRWSGSAFGTTAPSTLITRYPFTSGGVTPPALTSAPQTGWYWNAAESGTGWFIEMQGSQIFLATYMYASDGTARWYVAQGTPSTSTGVFGSGTSLVLMATLSEYAGGETLTSGPRPSLTALAQGQVTVQFTSQTTATVTLPGGRQLQLMRFTQF